MDIDKILSFLGIRSVSGGTKKQTATIKKDPSSKPSRARRPKDASSLVITRKEKIPKFESVLSYSDGVLALDSSIQKDYAVLLISKTDKTVYILCSTESREKGPTDNNYLTIKERCRSQGYKTSQIYAPRQIIQIIYEKDRSNNGEVDPKKKEGYIADFDKMILEALLESISDVHIEVRKHDAQVRFRRHGQLSIVKQWTAKYARELASVVYTVLAEEKDVSFIETQQQAGRIERSVGGVDLNIRLNTIPVSGGFDMVMRLLRMDSDEEEGIKITDLGYSKGQVLDIRAALRRPVGVIIIAGTTGSGKSTSLSVMLNGKIEENWTEDGPTIKVITVEDPTEYTIKGASQSGVVRKRGSDENPFAESIKAAMRCDPDILMVGEVRDNHSAELLVGAVQSGHTALTTVHASSGVNIVARLRSKSMGIPSDVLGSTDFISALIYQTLLPVACKKCSISLSEFKSDVINENDEQMLSRLNEATKGQDLSRVIFRNPKGCSKCTNGISGRTVVAEVILPNQMMRSAFSDGNDTLALYHHLKRGGKLVLDHGIEKIVDGISDPRDVEKKVGDLNKGFTLDELEESLFPGMREPSHVLSTITGNDATSSETNISDQHENDVPLKSSIFAESKEKKEAEIIRLNNMNNNNNDNGE